METRRLGRTGHHSSVLVYGGAALAQATHNPVIVGIMETLNDLLVESRQRSLERRGRSLQSLRGHEAVAEALRRHDADGAALAMHTHIDQIARLLGQGPGRRA